MARKLHPVILGVVDHYQRQDRMTPSKAWDAIRKDPFRMTGGHVVTIENRKLPKAMQRMRVTSPDGTLLHEIGYSQWRQGYWDIAAQKK